MRGFTEPTAEGDLTELRKMIKPMEEEEMSLVKKYGIPIQFGTIDSDDVFWKAEMLGDAKSSGVLSKLRKHCAKITNIERYLVPTIPSSATPAGMDAAIIIGIDAYNNPWDSLHGCISDALNFKDYLAKDLKVPVEKIQLLLSRNSEHTTCTNVVGSTSAGHIRRSIPTRSNIVSALVGISENTKIGWGDNTIVFFSGHGTCYPCTMYFMDMIGGQGNVEALCPMDWGLTTPDISDREMNIILKQICHSKGHRITVFLDCCHSASATRRPSQGYRAACALEESLGQDMLQASTDMQRTNTDGMSVRLAEW
ncbi:hypothetical protein ARMGADRAFT_1089818 [Armillaria gallica]|uniref:Peptidase C14 caspase domain-containing protein n=1 Tax=Armillaria gallica TaxID=47427 RepID=A0A2H3CIP5_ARMGA|nr:hypothetical protein ARMGADRAFT_1089818 [Armillaria gallica]